MRGRASSVLWTAGWPMRRLLLIPIGAYRLSLGKVLGGRCRFYPSCSEYAERAIRQTGATRGLILTLWRVVRCSPLSGGGIDRPPTDRLWTRSAGLEHDHRPGRQHRAPPVEAIA